MTTKPAMERQHFEVIASVIRNLTLEGSEPEEERAYVAGEFAGALHATNPKFNRDRFLKACGVEK